MTAQVEQSFGGAALKAADSRICAAHLRQGSKSFALAGKLLPARVLIDATALYAFCRVADDLIDDSDAPKKAHALLQARLEALVKASGAGNDAIDALPYPEDRALGRTMARHGLPRAPIDALLEGFLWDAEGHRYETMEDTLAYSARVAGSVGVCMAWLMGQRRAQVLARAADLGVAMQLSNIARDVGEDARRGRVYLPEEALHGQGIDGAAVLRAAHTRNGQNHAETGRTLEAVRRVNVQVVAEADVLYARGRSGIAALPLLCRWAIDAAACIYRAIGEQVLHIKPYNLHQRAVVPLRRKLRLILLCLVHPGGRRGTRALQEAPPLQTTQFLLDPLP